jgi:ABC-type sugar transport system substrate-binding protein
MSAAATKPVPQGPTSRAVALDRYRLFQASLLALRGLGSLGISTLYDAVKGKKVPKNVDTGTAFVTKANAGKFG